MVLPGTTPSVSVDEISLDSLGPCVQRYILPLETLAELRLSVRSDVRRIVGAGDGTDNQDFLADLSTLEVIDPDLKDED